VSQEFQIEVRFTPEPDQIKPAPDELALISAMLPELLKIMQQMEEDLDD
jgi:hypothetical protein